MKRSLFLSGLLAAAMLIAGCSIPLLDSGAATPPERTYILEWTPNGPAPKVPADAPSLLISPTRAGAGYGGSDMVYVRQAYELEHFAYHRWADSPARMLEPLVLAAAVHSGHFGLVLPAGSQALTDLRLDTRLLYLRQVFEPAGCREELGVRIDLIKVASGLPLGSRMFSYREACAEGTPQAGVAAANRAVAHFLEDLGPALSKF